MNDAQLTVTEVELPDFVRNRVWKAYRRGLSGDMVGTFLIVAFLMLGLSWIVLTVLTNVQATKLVACALGALSGALACGYIGAKEVGFFMRLRFDFFTGKCEKISAIAKNAIAVDLPGGTPGVALDCGSYTLVLLGQWWKNSRETGVEWSPIGSRKGFPAARFSMLRLPSSGLVVSVSVEGERLKVRKGSPMEPELSLSIPKYMNAYWIERELGCIPMVRFSGQG